MNWRHYKQLLLDSWNWEPDGNSWWMKFIKECKIPGLKDAIKPKIPILKRAAFVAYVVWCFWLTIKTTLAFWFVVKASPVEFTFESTPKHSSEIPFPTVVFGKRVNFSAGQLLMFEEFMRRIRRDGSVELDDKTTAVKKDLHRMGFLVNHICHQTDRISKWYSEYPPLQLHFLEYLVRGLTIYDYKESSQFTTGMIDFLKKGIPRCSTIIKRCSINGKPVNCGQYVMDIQTDIGAACAINKPPDAALKRNLGLYSVLNGNDVCEEDVAFWLKWQLNRNIFKTEPVKANCSKFIRTYPMTQFAAGQKYGFSFVLEFDAEEDRCIQNEGKGYFLDLLTPLDEPELSNRGIAIPMNHEVFIAIDPDITIAEESIRKYDMMLRGCSFTDEVKLKNYKHYTQANCERERLANLLMLKCNCSMISFPNENGTLLCTSKEDIECAQQVERNYTKGNHSIYSHGQHETICLPSCTEIKYNERISFIPYDPENPPSIVGESTNSSKMTSIVHIYMEKEYYNCKIRAAKFDDSQIFATIGGTLGTTNGLCYIDAGRVVYHLLEILWSISQFLVSLLVYRFGQTFSTRRRLSQSSIPPPPPSPSSDPDRIQYFQLTLTQADYNDISINNDTHSSEDRIETRPKRILYPTFPTLHDIETDYDSDLDDILLSPEPYERTEVFRIAIESDNDEEIESANYDLLVNIFPPPFPLSLKRLSLQLEGDQNSSHLRRFCGRLRNRIFGPREERS